MIKREGTDAKELIGINRVFGQRVSASIQSTQLFQRLDLSLSLLRISPLDLKDLNDTPVEGYVTNLLYSVKINSDDMNNIDSNPLTRGGRKCRVIRELYSQESIRREERRA